MNLRIINKQELTANNISSNVHIYINFVSKRVLGLRQGGILRPYFITFISFLLHFSVTPVSDIYSKVEM